MKRKSMREKGRCICLLLLLIFPFCLTGGNEILADAGNKGAELHQEAERAVERKDYRAAADYYWKLHELNDSIHNEISLHKVTELKDSIQIQELVTENAQMQSSLMQQLLWGMVALCVVVVGAFFTVYRRVEAMKKKRRELSLQIKELEQTTANKSLFISNMSHEIRTPLNALVGFSDILCTMDLDSDSYKQFNDVIQLNSQLLIKLIDDVVDLSTLNLKDMKFNLEHLDAVSLCGSVVKSIQQIKQTDADILFQTGLDKLVINTDVQRLQQVLINIIVNATKFCKQGSITLALELRDGEAYFTVTDTGCGIPPEQQSKVFGRFEKLNEHADGTGLGLSICEIIIKYLGGRIGIDPAYTGGTRFYFTHPIVNAAL